MKVSINKYLMFGIFLIGAMLFITNNVKAQDNEIAITTSSQEAREQFITGRDHMENARYEEARVSFTNAINEDPGFALAHLYLALSAPTEVEFHQHLQHALDNKSDVSEGEQMMIDAIQASANNKLNQSIETWGKLVERYPEDKRAHQYLGIAYLYAKHDQKAIEAFDKAISLDNNYAPAYNLLGYAYKETGDYDNAENAFKKYVNLLPNEANPHDSIADLYTKMGQHQDAINHYEKAVQINPKFDFSQQKIGNNLVFMGKYDEARKAYKKAQKMASTDAARINHMKLIAHSYLYEGNYDRALTAAKDALQMSKKKNLPEMTASIYSEMCDIYLAKGDLEKAKRTAEKCGDDIQATDLPDQVKEYYAKKVLFHEAIIAAKGKNFDQALKIADTYHDHVMEDENPLDVENYHSLFGYIHFEKGDFEHAITEFQQANQSNPHVLYHLALAYSEIGNDEAASKYFDKAANWNEHSIEYALIRTKAQNANHKMMEN